MRGSMIAVVAIAAALGLPQTSIAQSVREWSEQGETARVPRGDPDMEAAFRKARATLDQFLKIIRERRGTITSYAVKVPIRQDDRTEYFWVNELEQRDKKFIGRISNAPRSITNISEGQRISFERRDIVDWLYRENGRMVGNYTACALIKRAKPADAEEFKKRYGLNCDP